MKIIKYAFLTGVVALVSSCNKMGQGKIVLTTNSIVSAITSDSATNTKYDLVISLDKTQTPFGISTAFSFFGDFVTKNVGVVSINNKQLNFDAQQSTYFLKSTIDTTALEGKETQFFGLVNNIAIGSSNYEMYVPEIVNCSFTNCKANGDFDKASGITVSWVIDDRNLVNPVVVALEYSPIKGKNEELFPTKELSATYYTVDESAGTFTIPDADLANFPVGCMPTIHVARGNSTTTPDGKKILAFDVVHNSGRILQ
jgi:hypothetical protein